MSRSKATHSGIRNLSNRRVPDSLTSVKSGRNFSQSEIDSRRNLARGSSRKARGSKGLKKLQADKVTNSAASFVGLPLPPQGYLEWEGVSNIKKPKKKKKYSLNEDGIWLGSRCELDSVAWASEDSDFCLRDPRLREAEQILNKKIADEAAWWASATYLTEPVDWSNRQTDKQLTSPKHSVLGLDTKPLPPIKTESMPSPISRATDLVKKVVPDSIPSVYSRKNGSRSDKSRRTSPAGGSFRKTGGSKGSKKLSADKESKPASFAGVALAPQRYREWREIIQKKVSLNEKGLRLGSRCGLDLESWTSENSNITGFSMRDPSLIEGEQLLTKKIAEEAAWWQSADYMTQPIDWSNRKTSSNNSNLGLDSRQVQPISIEMKPSPFSRDTDFFHRVILEAEKKVQTNMLKSKMKDEKTEAFCEHLQMPAIIEKAADGQGQTPAGRSDTSQHGRSIDRHGTLPQIHNQNVTDLLYKDLAASFLTLLQQRESLLLTAKLPRSYQMLNSIQIENQNIPQFEESTSPDFTNSSRPASYEKYLQELERKQDEKENLTRKNQKGTFGPAVKQMIAKMKNTYQTMSTPDKTPTFRPTGKVVVRKNEDGQRKFKFKKMSRAEIQEATVKKMEKLLGYRYGMRANTL